MFFYISMLQVQLMKYVITSEITAMFVLPSIIFCYRVFVFMFLFFLEINTFTRITQSFVFIRSSNVLCNLYS
jgi:hypothetical protein